MGRVMSETAEAEMTAEQAATALADLEGYEQSLTARTAGLTWIVWGTAIPGLFATYNAAGHWVMDHAGPEWILGLLWIPWVAGASLATNWLWDLNAVRLEVEHDRREGWLYSGGFTLMFFVLAALVSGALSLVGIDVGTNGWMVLTVGVFTLALAGVYHRNRWPGVRETMLAGLAIVLGGLPIALAPASLAPDVAFGLASAGLVGLAYYGAGVWLYRRG